MPDETADQSGPAVTPSRRTMLLAATAGLVAVAGLGPENGTADARPRPIATTLPSQPPPGRFATTPALPAPAPRAVVVTHPHARPPRPVRSLEDVHRPAAAFASRAVMLTLDDGPSPHWTPKFLALLQRHGVTATFFLIGRQVPRDPGLVRETLARGHVIGNHTWTHDLHLGRRSTARIRSEIERTNEAIHTASGSLGYVPYLFRAPGGNWTPRLLRVLAEQHLLPVGWRIDPTDWARPGTKRIERTLEHTRPHEIVLCHDGGGDRSQTYRALQRELPRWQRRGFSFATLPPG